MIQSKFVRLRPETWADDPSNPGTNVKHWAVYAKVNADGSIDRNAQYLPEEYVNQIFTMRPVDWQDPEYYANGLVPITIPSEPVDFTGITGYIPIRPPFNTQWLNPLQPLDGVRAGGQRIKDR